MKDIYFFLCCDCKSLTHLSDTAQMLESGKKRCVPPSPLSNPAQVISCQIESRNKDQERSRKIQKERNDETENSFNNLRGRNRGYSCGSGRRDGHESEQRGEPERGGRQRAGGHNHLRGNRCANRHGGERGGASASHRYICGHFYASGHSYKGSNRSANCHGHKSSDNDIERHDDSARGPNSRLALEEIRHFVFKI